MTTAAHHTKATISTGIDCIKGFLDNRQP